MTERSSDVVSSAYGGAGVFARRLEHLAQIVDRSPAVAFIWKAEPGWPVLFVSENIAQFGYTAEDFTSGRVPFSSMVHPEDLPRIAAEVEEHTQSGDTDFRQVYRVVTRGGEVRWVDDRTWIGRDSDGRVTHYQGILLDITEQKAAESRIEHLNAVLRAIRNVNQLICQCHDRDELLEKACINLTETRGYRSAWIAVRNGTGEFSVAKEAGLGGAFREMADQLVRNELPPCVKIALEQPEPVLLDDPGTLCAGCSLDSSDCGTAAMVTRLAYDGQVLGVLAVTSYPSVFRDPEERDLFKEVAGDLSFALHNADIEREHDKAVRALQDSEEFLDASLNALSANVAVLDSMGKIVAVNAAWQQFARENDYGDEQAGQGQNYLEVCENAAGEFAEGARETAAGIRKLIAGRCDTLSIEYPCHRPGEPIEERWFLLRATPFRHGGQTWVVLAHVDITERQLALRALAEERDFTKAVLDTAGAMVIVVDRSGAVVRVNRQFEKITGYSSSETVGAPVWEILVSDEDRPGVRGVFDTLMRGESVARIDRTWQTRGGETRIISLTFTTMPGVDGDPQYIIATGLDVTEHRAAEEERARLETQLRQAQKMEAIGQLAGGVAHDFNNLLTAILGNVELMRERLGRVLEQDELLDGSLEQIDRAGQRAASLTRQLLSFSRRQVISPEVLDLNRILGDVEKMARRLIGEHIRLKLERADHLHRIHADAGQVEQVVINLVVNARDAMPDGGELVIRSSNVYLDESHCQRHPDSIPGDHVCLSISDTGSGMDDETLTHIFEPFFTTKPMGRGTGLGLSTVYGIVRQADGHIAVESTPGVGTTFRVYLPAVERSGEVVPDIAIDASLPGGRETVLLCEDEESVRQLARRFLQRGGYTVLEAGSGSAAVEIARNHDGAIDLLITDVILPDSNGRRVANAIQSERPEMKVLFVSGYTSDVIGHHGVLDEGVAFLEKPFTLSAMLQNVRDILHKS